MLPDGTFYGGVGGLLRVGTVGVLAYFEALGHLLRARFFGPSSVTRTDEADVDDG